MCNGMTAIVLLVVRNGQRTKEKLMKWKTIKNQPKEGDRRTVRKFAFFPVQTDYDYTVWLETYDSVQEYRYRARPNHHIGTVMRYDWDEIEKLPLFAMY